MKSFIAIALLALAAFASAEDEVEITETREICGAAGWRHGACKREILKREDCHRAGGMTHCNGKREDEEFERVETRELCKKTVSGIICGTEVLKRELCSNVIHGGARCRRLVVEGEEEEKEDMKRELCAEQGVCGRVEVEGEACSPAGKANGACKRIEAEVQEMKRDLCANQGLCGRMVAELCSNVIHGGSHCRRTVIKREDMEGDYEEVMTREECLPGPQARQRCGREILEKRRCHQGPTGPINCKRIEDEDHIKIEAREKCRIDGPSRICTKEILKREYCHVAGGIAHMIAKCKPCEGINCVNGKREAP